MQAQDEMKVAIFDPAGDVDVSLKNIIREEVSSIIVNTSGYTVLERQLINKVLEENKFQQGGLVDDSQVSEIGKRLGANYVLISSVTPLGDSYYISCKMIEVLTARIAKQKTGQTARGGSNLIPIIRTIVGGILEEPKTVVAKVDTIVQKPVSEVSPDVVEPEKPTAQPLAQSSVKQSKPVVVKDFYKSGMSKRKTGAGLIWGGVATPLVAAGIGYFVRSEEYVRIGDGVYRRQHNRVGQFALIGAGVGAGLTIWGISLKTSGSKEISKSRNENTPDTKPSASVSTLQLQLNSDGIGLSYSF